MLCPLKKNANLKEDHNKEMFNRFKRKCNKKKYKNRLKIECFFLLTKKSKLILLRYDRKTSVFRGSILLIILNIIFTKTNKNNDGILVNKKYINA